MKKFIARISFEIFLWACGITEEKQTVAVKYIGSTKITVKSEPIPITGKRSDFYIIDDIH